MLTPLYGSLAPLTLPRPSAAPASFDPLTLPWMVFFDAAQGTNATAVGDPVTTWQSLARDEPARVAYHAFGAAPVLSTYDGRPTIRGGTFSLVVNFDGGLNVGNDFTLFCVYKAFSGAYLVSKGNQSFAYGPSIPILPISGVAHLLNYNDRTPFLYPAGRLDVGSVQRTGSTLFQRTNGRDWTKGGGGPPFQSNVYPLVIASENPSSSGEPFFDGHIAAIGVARRFLTDTEMVALEAYYGVTPTP